MLSLLSGLKYAYLAYFSQPASDRVLYRAIHQRKVTRIVEIGVGTAGRAERMIRACRLASPDAKVYYTGVDLFDLRSPADGPGVSLKSAYKRLSGIGAKVRLVPGDPLSALARSANDLGGTDLLVVSAGHEPNSLSSAWFFVPRLLHGRSMVFVESKQNGGQFKLAALSGEVTARLAEASPRRRVA